MNSSTTTITKAEKKTELTTYIVVNTSYRPPKQWGSSKIEIFIKDNDSDRKLGEYERNYPAFGLGTFYPFTWKGRDYALYSKSYKSTRVMELPSCIDIGGEEHHGMGFCPVEYFIPTIYTMNEDRKTEIALIAGCIWGDDSSWKIQCITLDGIEDGELKRDERFGYIELARGVNMSDHVECFQMEPTDPLTIKFPIIQEFDLVTGKNVTSYPYNVK